MKPYLVAIREIRRDSGLLQSDVAAYLEITQGEYSRLERGITAMTVDRLIAIAEFLYVTPGDLLD